MAHDPYVMLRHPESGELKPGYFGFSRDNFWTLGFVWIRRYPPFFIQNAGFPLCVIAAFSLLFLLPQTASVVLDSALAVPVGGFNLPVSEFFAVLGLVLLLIINAGLSCSCNRAYTHLLLREGYQLVPGPNEQAARKDLHLPGHLDGNG